MLVLSRKTGQEILIGGNITVRVLEVRGNRVRLGLNAPDEIEIQRAELVLTGRSALPSQEGRMPVSKECAGSQLLSPSV